MKRRITVLALAMVLVLALSTFTRAANYVGLGIGIVGQAAQGYEPAGPYIGTLALDLDVVDKLTLSAHGYLEVNKEDAPAAALLAGYELNYMVSAFAKYELFNLNGLGIGPVVGVNYNSNFAPGAPIAEDPGAAVEPTPTNPFKFGAGVYAKQPLGETATIYGQVMYWFAPPESGASSGSGDIETSILANLGGLAGINFQLTEKIAVKGQIEYVNQHTLFSIGVGYTF
ncbi:MAG: hypothetical protein WBK10_10120 [Bacillota bacterium]